MAYEKMACLYETEKDLVDRLGGTVCRYKGVPYVVHIEARTKINLLDLVSQKPVLSIRPNDPDFDISSAEIGYINFRWTKTQLKYSDTPNDTSNKAYYLERVPFRRYRQGLCSDSLSGFHIDGKTSINPNALLFSDGFRDSQLGRFPSVREAIKLLEEEQQVAVGMDTALQKVDSGMILVWYRTKNIGWITPDNPTITIARTADSWVHERVLKRFLNA
jgi:hypothetical protein